MHADAMTDSTERRRFLACLSDPSRFSLVTMLAAGPRCVSELATQIGLSQSCTTRHLQALLRESIVVAERRGKRVVYALCQEGKEFHPVLRWACEPVEGRDDRPAAPPEKSRPRSTGETIALEPEPVMGVAVEHESGWTEADTPGGRPVFEASDPEPEDEVMSAHGEGPLRARVEMDDFLL
jgi:DNA-binding transcriptional ArsR family regulator